MRIILCDDDPLITGALQTILTAAGIDVCAAGNNAQQAVQLYRKHCPDIVLLDIRMGEKSGLDAAREILVFDPSARILFLTTFSDNEYIFDALKIGAKGYLLKQNYDSIVPALHAVLQGQNVYGKEVITKLPDILSGNVHKKTPEHFGLSQKETEIISAVAKGLSNKEISAELFLSEGTVRNYISVILEKLCLRDRTQLAVFYFHSLSV